MKDYGKYNSTIKTVQTMATQAINGYEITANDRRSLLYAIKDLCYLYDESKGGSVMLASLEQNIKQLLEEY